MRATARFSATLFAALFLAWLVSGERFLDAAFEMMDLGQIDDILLQGLVWLEEGKASLGLPDVFSALRGMLHKVFGLG